MNKQITPIQLHQRSTIVDIVRGLALVGVLMANFTGYTDEQVPPEILQSISSPLDIKLSRINSVFFEWKFMTLFSILFGYGFGLLMSSVEKKGINTNSFFARRMFWLFFFGLIHTAFWWFDVLHLYAMSGLLLLLFRKSSDRTILYGAILCTIVFPFLTSWALVGRPDTFTEADGALIFEQFKYGNLYELIKANFIGYYKLFVVSFSEIHDVTETLGRFLFGYFLLRINLFDSIDSKKSLFGKTVLVSAPLMLIYFIVKGLVLSGKLELNSVLWEPIIKSGIVATSVCYASLLTLFYISFPRALVFRLLEALGKMTLTNYLLVSAVNIFLLYGIGLGKLGEYSMHTIWFFALCCLVLEVSFSLLWLKHFRYGPVEWIWRQLTYGKRLPLKKDKSFL